MYHYEETKARLIRQGASLAFASACEMLTLAQSLRIGPVSVFRDVEFLAGAVSFTSIFYVLPDAPRLSRNEDGGPAVDFLWYRSTASGDPNAGGVMTLILELTPTPDQSVTLAPAIADSYGIPPGDVQVRPVPFTSGSIRLTYAGEIGSGEFSNQISGNGQAQLIGGERATFVVDLSADGSALLWTAIDQHLRTFRVQYDLLFQHRLASVHMHIWCDVANSLKEAGGSDPASIGSTLIANKTAGIEITSEQPLPPEERAALQKSGQDLLDRALGSALFAPGDGKSAPKLLPYSPSMEAALNFNLDQSFPLEQHAVLDALLDIDLTPEQASRQVRTIDLTNGFFSILDVQIVCTVDFATDPISLVRVRIEYDQTGDNGRVQRSGEFVFKAESDLLQHFRTDLAAPGKTAYTYRVDVFFQGDHSPFQFDGSSGSGVLVLDLDAAGVLNVRVDLRDVPFDKVSSAVIDFAYPSKGLSAQIIVDGKCMSGCWQTVIAEPRQPWKYRVTWVLLDGRRLEGTWVETSDLIVSLGGPVELRSKQRVLVVASGDFSDLNQIIVDLRNQPDGSAQTQIALTTTGQTQLWEWPAPPASDIAYQYRRTLMYKDGRNRILDPDWVPDTRPVLVVANDLSFRVQIIPKLLDLGVSLRMVVLELQSEAEHDDAVQHATLVVRTKNDPLEWTFGLDRVDRHQYRYRLTPVPVQGDHLPPSEWRESDAEILILQIPHD